jgi:hypothetical protein
MEQHVTLHEQILEELRISRKEIAAGQRVTPRFLIYTPSGNHTALMPPDDERGPPSALFKAIWLFMVWKAATGFILSTETETPDVVTATLVTRRGGKGAHQIITREPLGFSEPVWYGRQQLGNEIFALLPPATVQLGEADAATIRDWEANGILKLALN